MVTARQVVKGILAIAIGEDQSPGNVLYVGSNKDGWIFKSSNVVTTPHYPGGCNRWLVQPCDVGHVHVSELREG